MLFSIHFNFPSANDASNLIFWNLAKKELLRDTLHLVLEKSSPKPGVIAIYLSLRRNITINMGYKMNATQIFSFVGFTLLVAVITWWKVRKTDTGSQQGYFLAGRSLKAPVIAASLMLTNLSTEQLVGLSGQAYKSGMSVMGWEVTSAVTLIFLALIFLPRYLQRGIATIPDFLEERYDKTTRIIIDFCFLIATGVCFLPIVLYSGALALNSLFHVGESLNISQGAASGC